MLQLFQNLEAQLSAKTKWKDDLLRQKDEEIMEFQRQLLQVERSEVGIQPKSSQDTRVPSPSCASVLETAIKCLQVIFICATILTLCF